MARPVKFLKKGGMVHSDEAQDKKLIKKMINKAEKKEGKEMKSGGFNSPKDYKVNATSVKKEPKEIPDKQGKETSKPKPESKMEKKEPKSEGSKNTDMARGGMRGPRGPNKVPKGLGMASVPAPMPMAPPPTGAPGGAPGAMPGMAQGMKKGGAKMKCGGTKLKSGGVVVAAHTKDYAAKK